jgi:predicted phage terminase large subunit-like protein
MAENQIIIPTDRELEIAKYGLAKKRLRSFVEQAWPVLEPSTPFKPNWHIDCICDHLEAITRGEIRKLIINVPPGSMKSLLTGVFWPAWEWIQHPGRRWLYGAYKETLAHRDSRKTRRLISSKWYQERFGHIYHVLRDQDSRGKFENDKTGVREAVGVMSGTGARADRVIWDDPHNIEKTESQPERDAVIHAWRSTWSERIASEETSARLVIMQRLHQEDISGFLLELGGWEHLAIPTEYEGQKYFDTSLHQQDPRKKDGDLLWPHHVDKQANEDKKKTLGPYGYAGQHQQRPAPKDGAHFKEEWFQIVDVVPVAAHRVRYWDNASTDGGGDFTSGVLMAKSDDGIYWVEDVVRGQWGSTERDAVKRKTAENDREKYGGRVMTWDVQDPGSAGKDAAAASVRNLAGFSVRTEYRSGSKETNADPLRSQAGAGNVRILRADWNKPYLAVMCLFPFGKFDDDVDASSGAFSKLAPLGSFSQNWKKKIELNYDLGFGKRKR